MKALIVMATPAAAQESPCAMMGMMAKEIMAIRQMSDLMGTMLALEDGPERNIAIAMVKDAYAQPRYTLPDFQQQAINDFRVVEQHVEPKTIWVNEYGNRSTVWPTESDAREYAASSATRIAVEYREVKK